MIVCPHCATSYNVQPDSLGSVGRSVRCVRCSTVWFARPVEEPSPEQEQAKQLANELVSAAEALGATVSAAPALPEANPPEPAAQSYADAEAPLSAIDSPVPQDAHAPTDLDAASGRQFEQALDDSPSIIPPIEQLAALPTALPDPNDEEGESFAARRERLHARRKKQRLPVPSTAVTILLLTAVLAGLVGWRKKIVQIAPQTASLYARIGLPVNLRGVVFENVKTTRDTNDGIPVLVVEGFIGSHSNTTVEVPRLRFAVRNAAGGEIYSWTAVPGRSTLAPGEQLAFKSRLASPPDEGRDVTVRFFNRHDVVAGVR